MISVILLALLLSGCTGLRAPSPKPTKESNSRGVTTVRVGVTEGSISGEYINLLTSSFQTMYPDYRVEVRSYPHDPTMTATWTDLEKGELDIISTFPGLLEPSAAADLLPLMRKDGLDALRYGNLLGTNTASIKRLPYAIMPHVLLLNREHFDRANVPIPKAEWTWDDLRSVSAQLSGKSDDRRRYGLAANEELAYLWLHGRSKNRHSQPDSKALLDAMGYFYSLIFTDQAMPPVISLAGSGHRSSNEQDGSFWEGQSAIGYGPLPDLGYQRRLTFPATFLPIPVHPGGRRVSSSSSLWLTLSDASPRKEAAWAFLTFATSEPGAVILARAGVLPAYQSDLVATAWTEASRSDASAAKLLLHTEWIDGWGVDLLQGTGFAFNQLMSGTMSVEEAVDEYTRRATR